MMSMWMKKTASGLPIIPPALPSATTVMGVMIDKTFLGNTRSLVNDQVHDVVEDSDGAFGLQPVNGISSIRLIQRMAFLL